MSNNVKRTCLYCWETLVTPLKTTWTTERKTVVKNTSFMKNTNRITMMFIYFHTTKTSVKVMTASCTQYELIRTSVHY